MTTLTSHHSFYGKILFDATFYEEFSQKIANIESNSNEKKKADALFFILTHTIYRHHSSLVRLDEIILKLKENTKTREDLMSLNQLSKIFLIREIGLSPDNFSEIYSQALDILDTKFIIPEQKEAIFYLYKLVYSLLITSDYYASLEFMQGISYKDKINIIDGKLGAKFQEVFLQQKSFNSKLNDTNYCNNITSIALSKIDLLNDLRTRILLDANEKMKEAILDETKRVFYLNVPTGGGKTNVSLKLALTLLEKRPQLKRIFYVFPFINIIEQNYTVIKETLNLGDEISPIYSTSQWQSNQEDKNEQLQYVLDNEFLNFPVIVMSNVNFFNTFIKASKTSQFRLCNLANSIVILDEIQSLNDSDWTLYNDFIRFSSEFLDINSIIMSATIPKLDKITLKVNNEKEYSTELIPNTKDIFGHKLFNERVSLEYCPEITSAEMVVSLVEKEVSSNNYKKSLIVANTIADSRLIYTLFKKSFLQKDYPLFLLNSTILPHRRKEIIAYLNKLENKAILISTQSVEAGVDIDCDFGVRDFAIFESIEQVAGRINRNNNGSQKRLIVITLKNKETGDLNAKYIYKNSKRWKIIEEYYNTPDKIKKFLAERNFHFTEDGYYQKVIDLINTLNLSYLKQSQVDVVQIGLRKIDFTELNKKDVIDQNSFSLFIMTTLSQMYFTTSEISFLKTVGVNCSKSIAGRDVWEKYGLFHSSFLRGFVDNKIDTKRWASIISKFIIYVQDYYVDGERHSLNLGLKVGINLIKEGYYSEEFGLNPKELRPEMIDTFTDFMI